MYAFPLAFLFIPVLIAVAIFRVVGQKKQGLRFSSSTPLKNTKPSIKQRLMFLPMTLTMIAAVLFIIALARPQEQLDENKKITNGIAMELVVDRSGSMELLVEDSKGKRERRIDIVKKNLRQFVSGNGTSLTGRGNDLIGLIAFATYADTLAPLTLSHKIVDEFLATMDIADDKSAVSTSIGDAVALAAARLKTVGENNDPEKGYVIKNKIILLLTDGVSNDGNYTPREAAEMAAKWGIKIYAIGFGGIGYDKNGWPLRDSLDTATLKGIAEISGGRYFEAKSAAELAEVYAEIDSLETSEIQSTTRYKYKELFVGFALAGVLFLAAALLLDFLVFRRIP